LIWRWFVASRSIPRDPTTDRLERLERKFRRWKFLGIAFAVLVGAPELLLLAVFLMSDGSHEAQRVLIRDSEGQVRMDIGTDRDGKPRSVRRSRRRILGPARASVFRGRWHSIRAFLWAGKGLRLCNLCRP
jgi:hypothetical protein